VFSPALASAFGPGGTLQGEALLRAMALPSSFLPPIATVGGLGPAPQLRAGGEDRGAGEASVYNEKAPKLGPIIFFLSFLTFLSL
jgi:hypothetical protein